jgi:hypothetical protein
MQTKKYSPKIFNDILSDSIDRILKGESAEILLWENPEMAGDLKPLFSMALSMKMFSKIQAPAEFKARARREFQELLKVKVNRD